MKLSDEAVEKADMAHTAYCEKWWARGEAADGRGAMRAALEAALPYLVGEGWAHDLTPTLMTPEEHRERVERDLATRLFDDEEGN